MFNDNSNPNPSHFSQLPQSLPQPFPENLDKHCIANNVVSNKQAIKLPPLSLPHFNGNPLRYHEWINNFFSMVHNNTGITDTHRITYLQNSGKVTYLQVSGKAKQIIESYSCNPAYYETALNEQMNHFGDPSVVVSAFINQLESWHTTDSNNKKIICRILKSSEAFSSNIRIPWLPGRPSEFHIAQKSERKSALQYFVEMDCT